MRRSIVTMTLLAASLGAAAPAYALDQKQVDAIVERLDVRQRSTGDYRALCYIEQKERGKNDLLYQAAFYRRDDDDKLMILFLKPKSETGKGYLRLDKSMFMYDPTVGKWERRTERERIMGTDSRRGDFDESRLAQEYAAKFVKDTKLGKRKVHQLKMTARKGQDVAYPTLELWVDVDSGNLLKRQDFALSGRLMRTTYYPKWKKVFSEDKGAEVYYPEEIHIYDEVEKGNRTTMALTEVDLRPLSENIFTKAWLESKSR